jgi:hypothetical protein
VNDPRLLYLAGATFASAFIGAIVLRAAIHATNVMLRTKRGGPLAVPSPSFDWSVTLLLIANVLNLGVGWLVPGFAATALDPGLRADKEFAQFFGILIAFPVNMLVTVLVLQAGLPTTFLRGCLVVFFHFVFSVVFAIAVGAVALVVVSIAWATGGFDEQAAVILGIIVGVIVAIFGFAACMNKLDEARGRAARDKPAPTPVPAPAPAPVAPPRALPRHTPEVWQGTAAERRARLVVALWIMVIVIGVLLVLLPRLAS